MTRHLAAVTRGGSSLPAYALVFLLALAAIVSGFYLKAGVALIGYGLLSVLVFAFLKYPRGTLLAALAFKPIIDMFWWTKGSGLLSPLFLAGVTVPILALLGLPRVARRRQRLLEDRFVLGYIAAFLFLTLCKIATAPQFTANSVEHYIRILSVTSFYFIGKYYFPTPRQRFRLVQVLTLSAVVPFVMTAAQQAFGWNVTTWEDVTAQTPGSLDSGLVTAFYIGGRHNLQRVSGVYEGVYTLAFLGVITALILLATRLSRDVRFHPSGYLLFALAAYFTYFTYSRSAWVTLTLTAVLFFAIRREAKWIVAISSSAAFLYITVETVRFRFEDELGFLFGSSSFYKVGYGRGGKWAASVESFLDRETLFQMIGTYGQGNPENQFLNVLHWFGYLGLACFVLFLVLMTRHFWQYLRESRKDNTFDSNMRLIFASLITISYWFAGLGNSFFLQISTQWVLWLWTGIIFSVAAEERQARRSAQLATRTGPRLHARVR